MRPIDRLVLLCLLVTAVACGGSGSSNGDQQQDGSANTDASDSAVRMRKALWKPGMPETAAPMAEMPKTSVGCSKPVSTSSLRWRYY